MAFIVPLRYTRNLFLRVFCTVFLAAFISLYHQAPGLYGDNGVLPARSVLENSKHKSLSAKIHYQPTLLWWTGFLGLSTSYAVEFLALLGIILSFTGILTNKFCTIPVFTALWSLFFSLYQIGQVFVTNNFDEYLLEAGFLAILLAPLTPNKRKTKNQTLDFIAFWLCRLLLFKFLFTAGLGKLLSGCPKWWTLTALNHHFETMPLPNTLSYLSHFLPSWILRMSTLYANICEIFVPFLFFVPLRTCRIVAFFLELFLQGCILFTGNFGHANLLTLTLLLSLIDDQCFYGKKSRKNSSHILSNIFSAGIFASFTYMMIKLYNIKYNGGILEAQIAFTKGQLNNFLDDYFPFLIMFLLISLAITIILCLKHIFDDNYRGDKIAALFGTTFYSIVAVSLLFANSTPLQSIHPTTNSTLNPIQRGFYNRVHKAKIVNEYNLFPKMHGTEGRPEIILEGSDNLEGPWKEYNFLYKPGNVNQTLAFIAPYSPKLDWQFYWAAQSTYNKESWLLSLTHRLLIGSPEVLKLIDAENSPKTPRYIRASLFKYKFTKRHNSAWWIREKVADYFPAYTKDSPALLDFLKARNLLPAGKTDETLQFLRTALNWLRFLITGKFGATFLFWAIICAALAIVGST